MKKPKRSATGPKSGHSADEIAAYANGQAPLLRAMCNRLRTLIDSAMPEATWKVWHGSPVWFIDDNPVVGYSVAKEFVNLLFWNGRAFDEPDLKPVGRYGAAQASFAEAGDINATVVRRWLKKARSKVFDSKAFFQKLRTERKAQR